MGGGSPAVNTTDRIKLSTNSSRFVAGPTLKAKKQYLSCLSMPDGTLLEAGGGSTNKAENASYEVSMLKYPDQQDLRSAEPDPDRQPPALPLLALPARRRSRGQHRVGSEGTAAQ